MVVSIMVYYRNIMIKKKQMVRKNIIYGTVLSLALLLLGGCVKEKVAIQDNGDTSLSLVFPTSRGLGDDPEFVMDELRVIIFKSSSNGMESGAPVLNKLYTPVDAESFEINEIVPVGYLNIYIIANETSNLGSLGAITSSSTLRAKLLDYNTGNNVLPASPPPPPALPTIPPILMYSEYRGANIDIDGNLTHHNAKLVGDKTVLEVFRTIAKITVNIECDFSNMPNNTEIKLTDARIVSMPYTPALLANQVYTGSVAGDYFNSASLNLTPYIVSDANGFETISKGFTFYMPEHIPDIPGAANRNRYTYLEFTGETVGITPVMNITYKVPLGNGLGTTVGATTYTANYLLENYTTVPTSILTVSRNTWYNLSLNIKGFGVRDALEVIVKAKPWNPTININKDIE